MEDSKNKKDEDIVEEVLKNPDFYSEIIFRYQEKIIRYILRIAKVSKEDAEDLTQDVFLSAYENLNSFDKDLSFSSWIYRIAHNNTINFWKKRERELGNINLEENIFLVEKVFFENSVYRDIEEIENKEFVEKILKEMSQKYGEVLILYFLENKDYKEISDILQKPMGSVATLINRAKKQFRKKVEEVEQEVDQKSKKKDYEEF